MDLFDTNAKTYKEDLATFKRLGLKPFELNNKDKYFVGRYKSVDIYVECYPAMFWTFHFYDENYNISTGSGTFTYYWPTIELLVDGMIEITPA